MSASSDGSLAVAASQQAVSLFSSASHCRSARHFLSSVSPRCSLSVAPPLFYPSLLLSDSHTLPDVATHFLRSIAVESPFAVDPAYHLRVLRQFYASRVEQLQRAASHRSVDPQQLHMGQPAGESDSGAEGRSGAHIAGALQQQLHSLTELRSAQNMASSPSPDSVQLPQPASFDSLSALLASSAASPARTGSGNSGGGGAGSGSAEAALLLSTAPLTPHAPSAVDSALSSSPSPFVLPHHPSLHSSPAELLEGLGASGAAKAVWLAGRLPSASSAVSSDGTAPLPLPLAPPSAALSGSSGSSSVATSGLSFRRARAFPAAAAASGTTQVGGEQAADEAQQQQADTDEHMAAAVADHTAQRSHALLVNGRSITNSSEQWEKEAVSEQQPLHRSLAHFPVQPCTAHLTSLVALVMLLARVVCQLARGITGARLRFTSSKVRPAFLVCHPVILSHPSQAVVRRLCSGRSWQGASDVARRGVVVCAVRALHCWSPRLCRSGLRSSTSSRSDCHNTLPLQRLCGQCLLQLVRQSRSSAIELMVRRVVLCVLSAISGAGWPVLVARCVECFFFT